MLCVDVMCIYLYTSMINDHTCYLFSCYLYYVVHWFCSWVEDYLLSVWLLNPSIISFSPRYTSVGAYQVICYLMLIYVKFWSATLYSFIQNYQECTYIFESCNWYLDMYVILDTKDSCIAFHLSRSRRPCEPTIW